MNLQTLSALVAGILILGIGGSVLLRDKRPRRYLAFVVFCFNLSGWYFAHFFAQLIDHAPTNWLSLAFAAAIPVSAERFFRAFLAEDPRHRESVSRPVMLGTIFAYIVLILSLFFPIHQVRITALAMFVFVFSSLAYCIYLIRQRQLAVSPRPESTRLRYLFYGGLITIALAATDFIGHAGFTVPTMGNIMTVIYIYFFSQTFFHYRLLDIKELLGKMVTVALLVLILTVIYGALLAWVGTDRPGLFFFNTLVASFFVLLLSEPLRHLIEDWVNRWLFAEKYDFAKRLRLLSRDLANTIEVRAAVRCILNGLGSSGRVTHASVYLADLSGTTYRLEGHVGPEPNPSLDGMRRRLFFDHLRNGDMLVWELLERDLDVQTAEGNEDAAAALRNVMETMTELHATVTIPLIADDQLLGVLNLRDERIREAYASDELEHIRAVVAQAAITLRNSEIYEQMKERDRLAALGKMAAGLAHELKNPLGSIKGAAQLLSSSDPTVPSLEQTANGKAPASPLSSPPTKPLAYRPPPSATLSEANEYLNIIVEEVDRLDRVLSQFLGYARPDGGHRETVSINALIRRTTQQLRSQAQQVDFQLKLASELPRISIDPEQMHQVFLNIGLNAIQAMDQHGTLEVSTRHHRVFRRGEWSDMVEVQFRDTGKGIPEDKLPDIFIPFFTTKEQGTGLGLPISQRIVENHRGRFDVQSEVGVGSTITVSLPTGEDVTTQA